MSFREKIVAIRSRFEKNLEQICEKVRQTDSEILKEHVDLDYRSDCVSDHAETGVSCER